MDASQQQTTGDEALAQARAELAQQAAELERLGRRLEQERFAERLVQSLTLASAAGTVASRVTHSHLLEMIVQTAAQVISARAASLYLIDQEQQDLIFEVALGPKAEEVKKFRVPLGHGIAGLVALSGQPMAIADVSQDPRQASDIAESIGYKPQTMLCVPLFYNEEVIGVLQLLDKTEGTFTAGDMETLGIFANQAAVAIEQSRIQHNLAALVAQAIEGFGDLPPAYKEGLQRDLNSFVADLEQDQGFREALSLARLVQQIVSRGEAEARLCRTILQGFGDYAREQAQHTGGGGIGPGGWR